MTTRQKVWIGLVVGIITVLSPGIASPSVLVIPFFLAFSLIPLCFLLVVLAASRLQTPFWSAAVPAMSLMLAFYGMLRFSTDAQTGIAIMFVPLYATGAAIIGLGVYGVARLLFHRRAAGVA